VVALDTDHLSALDRGSSHPAALTLQRRLENCEHEIATTVVSVEEQLRGRLVEIQRRANGGDQIEVYRLFYPQVEMYARWTVLPWDSDAEAIFRKFREQRVRIGTMDLKIASIAIAHDATLLTRNTVDFAKVPGLQFENWID
jgi:tRNA(fMet)-specific endonuclease VapC